MNVHHSDTIELHSQSILPVPLTFCVQDGPRYLESHVPGVNTPGTEATSVGCQAAWSKFGLEEDPEITECLPGDERAR